MASSLEIFREDQLKPADPLNWHPMNQRMAKDIRARQEKGRNPKPERARRRREENTLQRQKLQFQKALAHMSGGYDDMDTLEVTKATDYVLTNVDNYERVIDTYLTREKTVITITFVDLPHHINGIDTEQR